jgi:hypothetical protein
MVVGSLRLGFCPESPAGGLAGCRSLLLLLLPPNSCFNVFSLLLF